ncbi:MAG TPA: hypothetical protein VLB84_11150, partial [Bacteroidia bacterium]|nr:hypothetical protein [Bacteroidia bacterium]
MAGVNRLLASKEPVPAVLNCEHCTNCTALRNLVNDFRTMAEAQEGGSIPEDKIGLYETNLTTYLNNTLNLDFGILDYTNFLAECDKADNGSYSCNAGPAAIELQKMLNLLVFEDQLLHWVPLCNAPYTPATLQEKKKWNFSYTDLLASKVDPSFIPGTSTCNQVYCFDHINENTLFGKIRNNDVVACDLELNFTEPGFEFANIRQISDLKIDPKNNGNNYNFLVTAAVVVEDKIVYTTMTGKTTCIPLGECSNDHNTLMLCSKGPELEGDDCVKKLTFQAFFNGELLYKNYIHDVKNEFVTRYVKKCLKAADKEKFTMKFEDGEYHYTLFYYDQAGNLVRTIPPDGVELIPDGDLPQVASDRKKNVRTIFTKHRMASTYEYNSLNALVSQSVPDHHKLNDWRTFSTTSGLISGMNIIKTQMNSENGTYMIADDPAAPDKSLIYYAPDGVSWKPVSDIGLSNLSSVHFFGSTGYVVGEKGMLLKTTDGNTWSLTSTGIDDDLKEIYFSSASNGIIITKSVNVYSTNDGGTNWNLQSGSGLDLDEIHELTFLNAGYGIAVGRKGVNGAVFRSTDGGLNWLPASTFVSTDLKTTQVLEDNKTVFACGVAGTVLKSTNGGQDWMEVSCNLSVGIKKIFFSSAL